jgi:dihydrofolate reductase
MSWRVTPSQLVKGSGLVDELHLMIGAGVLGAGTPAFEGRPPVSLRLVETRTWDGSSLLLTRYAVEPAA